MVSKKHASRYAANTEVTIVIMEELFCNGWSTLYQAWRPYEQSSDLFISSIGKPELAASQS